MSVLFKTSLLTFLLWQNQADDRLDFPTKSNIGQVDLKVINVAYSRHCLGLKSYLSPAREPEKDPEEEAFIQFRNQKFKEISELQQKVRSGEITEEEFFKYEKIASEELRQRILQEQKRIEAKRLAVVRNRELKLQDFIAETAKKYGLQLVVRKSVILVPPLSDPSKTEYIRVDTDITQEVLALMIQKGLCDLL